MFLVIFKMKRSRLSSQGFFCIGTMPQSTSPPQSRIFFMVAKASRRSTSLIFLKIAMVDYFLIRWVTSELADLLLSQDSFKTSLEVVVWSIIKDRFAAAIQWWMDCSKMCSWIWLRQGLKKSHNNGVSVIHIKIISPCAFESDRTM